MSTETKVAAAIQTWDTEALIGGIACTSRGSWLARVIANELVGRGVDHEGHWVGHAAARRLWVDASEGGDA